MENKISQEVKMSIKSNMDEFDKLFEKRSELQRSIFNIDIELSIIIKNIEYFSPIIIHQYPKYKAIIPLLEEIYKQEVQKHCEMCDELCPFIPKNISEYVQNGFNSSGICSEKCNQDFHTREKYGK